MPAEWKAALHLLFVCVIAAPVWSSQEICPPWERTEIPNAILHSNGSVEDPDERVLYPPHTYWKEIADGRIDVNGCPCKLDKPCLRKCCGKNQAMDNETLNCIHHENESRDWFRPNVSADNMLHFRQAEYGYFGLIYGNFCFGYILEPEEYKEDEFFINFTDGTLSILEEKEFGLNSANYCLEYLPALDLYLPYVCIPKSKGSQETNDICDQLRYTLYPIGMTISIIFLIISVIIYATTTELRNLHGKCLMCHIVSLLVAYIFLATVQSVGYILNENVCTAFGFVIYFAWLCSFFWLNIMCIDIYIAFSSYIPVTAHFSEMKKFLMYVIYAWGLPFVIVLVTAVMEFHPQISNGYMKPEFKHTCWFHSRNSRLAYFIAPVGVLIFCNVILFTLTAFNIYKVKRETSILQRGNSTRNREDKNRMKLYIKLSIIMGVSWILEIISYIIGGSLCIWLFTDFLNTLQGLFIFLIFVCKENVKKIVKKRLRRLYQNLSHRVMNSNPSPSSYDQKDDGEQSSSRSGATGSSNLPSLELQGRGVN